MYNVIDKQNKVESFLSLDDAMAHAKTINEFVTIKGNGIEVVGIFGVDGITDGKCPDGIDYTWKKRRI